MDDTSKVAMAGVIISILPEEAVLDHLEEALKAYRINPNDETKRELIGASGTVFMKFNFEGKDTEHIVENMVNTHKTFETGKKILEPGS